MKKLLLFTAITCFAFSATAQSTYKAFKVDIDFGYAIPPGSNGADAGSDVTKAGVTFTVEPHYRITQNVAVGFRVEGAGLGYENSDDNYKVALLTSYCLTGDYYFTKGGFRVFGGGGAGVFMGRSVYDNTDDGTPATVIDGTSKFGVFPRLGFEAGHFRMAATYDILGSNANYLGFTFGFFFGGGKKNIKN